MKLINAEHAIQNLALGFGVFLLTVVLCALIGYVVGFDAAMSAIDAWG